MARLHDTLAHLGGGEGIYPDNVERDDMPPPRWAPRRWFGADDGFSPGASLPSYAGEVDWRRAMQGDRGSRGESLGYGGQYARMPPGMPSGRSRDDRIYDLVCLRLKDDWELDPESIHVQVNDSLLTLDGAVEAPWMRGRVGELADVAGVRQIGKQVVCGRRSQQ